MKARATRKSRSTRTPTRLSKARLAEMIEMATVDAYSETEESSGWFTTIEEHLDLPFGTKVLGAAVTVKSIDLRDGGQIVANCACGRYRQAILLVDLPLPSPKPGGAEWIEAYRCWLRGSS